jgi:hypothetical protein
MHQLGQKMEIDSRKLMMLKRMTTKTMTYPHPLLPNVQLRNDLLHMVLLQRQRKRRRQLEMVL